MSIGKRTVELIKERAKKNGRSEKWELLTLEINETSFRDWEKERYDPSSYFLQKLALAGYDVMYILTGVKN